MALLSLNPGEWYASAAATVAGTALGALGSQKSANAYARIQAQYATYAGIGASNCYVDPRTYALKSKPPKTFREELQQETDNWLE